MNHLRRLFLCALLLGGCLVVPAFAAEPEDSDFDTWCRALDRRAAGQPGLFFSPRIGPELDAEESRRYGVLGRTDGFVSARLPVDERGRFRLELTLRNNLGLFETRRRFSPESLRATRLHLYLHELNAEQPAYDPDHADEAELIWRLALRFAARKRYALVQGLFEELAAAFPDAPAGRRAADLLDDVELLRRDRQALVWDYPPQQGPGSNDLKLFGGYYGLWLGIAVPLALESDSAGAYGAGLIAGGPIGYMTAAWACNRWEIDEGQATMIELGGNLGTWQGLGWSSMGEGDAGSVVSAGVLTGLAGIGSMAWLGSKYEFTEGHAALTAAAAPWGAWFGLIAANLTEGEDNGSDEGERVHRHMLIGADLAVLATGLAARGAEMSEKRVRLINLNGVIGSVMGLGLNLMIQPDDGDTVLMITGLTGAAGLAAGFRLTRNVDRPDEFATAGASGSPQLASLHRFVGPHMTTRPDYSDGRGVLPAVSVGWMF